MKHAIVGLATLLGGFLGLSQTARAQGSYRDDALLYSRLAPAGTARTLGLAGANVALGGDWGSVSANPAGLGLFTKSELTFSPGLGFGSVSAAPAANAASLTGTGGVATLGAFDQTANSFHVASAGVVFATRRPDGDNTSDWRGGAFALGITRQADFNQAFRYRNQTDDNHSFFQYLREPGGNIDFRSGGYQKAVDGIISQENKQIYTDLEGLAYGGYLTFDIPGSTPTVLNTPTRTGPITQDETVRTSGSLSQFDLAYGGNYRDRLYIGGGIGIVSLNRTRNTLFSESSSGGEDFNFSDNVKTTGTGVNARLGLIYRLVDAVRVGASVQTPTYIQLQDSYSTTLTSQYVPQGRNNVFTTVPGTYEYSVTTPFRASGGVAVVVNKYGFLTGDVEYVGYGQARLGTVNTDAGGGDFGDVNQQIRSAFRSTVNLRAGAEGRLDIFRVRAGYARYGSPYAADRVVNRAQNYLTGGLGLRTKSFFLDVAGVYLTFQDRYSPYSLAKDNPATSFKSVTNGVAPVIALDQNRLTVSLTGGIIF